MTEEEEPKKKKVEDAEEIKAVLGVVSKEVPALIKGIVGSVFSEEAGRDMGKAAGAFYRELKESGMPDEVAVKMTENYISVFTSLGGVMKNLGRVSIEGKDKAQRSEMEEAIREKIKKKLAEEGLAKEK